MLGVKLNGKLDWNSHVNFVKKKCCQRFHALRRLKPFLPPRELHSVYTAHIRSLIEYACPVFSGLNKTTSDTLQRIDDRAHRIIFGARPYPCNCQNINQRMQFLSVNLFNKITTHSKHLLHHNIPPHLRTKPKQHQNILCRTQKRNNSFFPLITRAINNEQQANRV